VKAAAQHSSSELGSAFALALHLSLSLREKRHISASEKAYRWEREAKTLKMAKLTKLINQHKN
jgi:hypothetical protein